MKLSAITLILVAINLDCGFSWTNFLRHSGSTPGKEQTGLPPLYSRTPDTPPPTLSPLHTHLSFHYVALASLELTEIHPSQPLKYWD